MIRQGLVAALAFASAAAPLATSAQPMYFHRGQYGVRMGHIAYLGGGSLKLDDGTTVFLNHTVINPPGRNLHPGQTIQIRGVGAGHGAINARVITIIRRY